MQRISAKRRTAALGFGFRVQVCGFGIVETLGLLGFSGLGFSVFRLWQLQAAEVKSDTTEDYSLMVGVGSRLSKSLC